MSILEGQWRPLGAELSGQAIELPETRFIVQGEIYVVDTPEARDAGRLIFHPDTAPLAVDVHGLRGPNAGKMIPAIARVTADVLELCYDVGDGPRPTDFSTVTGGWRLLVRYERCG